ncbi:Zinc knuckle [Trichostrongylus colubriformis]|uniref:Zinc knuckle n=1 Tax=Trichostrongylus colubriformis TaxID=6319 RepID=A0AAN8IGW2_TRICO
MRVVALGKLRKLRKPEAQSVAEYCVELERLSARAYPEMDERALATTRAQQLYDQIVHWPESYYFLEAMEQEGSKAYESLKEAAMRVERRRITLESTRSQKYQAMNDSFSRRLREEKSGETKLKEQGLIKDRPKVRQEGESPDKEKEDSKQPTKNEYIRCYNCKGRGHLAKDCKKKRELGSKITSMTVKEHQSTQNLAQQHHGMAVPQVGRKSITKVRIFNDVWSALLDTGSEISILPVKVLQRIENRGHRLQEHPVDKDRRILDASGNRMKFS